MKILVIDGQGGRLGRKLLENIRKICPEAKIIVGPFGIATADAMMGEISPAILEDAMQHIRQLAWEECKP